MGGVTHRNASGVMFTLPIVRLLVDRLGDKMSKIIPKLYRILNKTEEIGLKTRLIYFKVVAALIFGIFLLFLNQI